MVDRKVEHLLQLGKLISHSVTSCPEDDSQLTGSGLSGSKVGKEPWKSDVMPKSPPSFTSSSMARQINRAQSPSGAVEELPSPALMSLDAHSLKAGTIARLLVAISFGG